MPYQNFTEKEINSAVYKKAPLEDIQSGRNPHDIGKLVIDGHYFVTARPTPSFSARSKTVALSKTI